MASWIQHLFLDALASLVLMVVTHKLSYTTSILIIQIVTQTEISLKLKYHSN